MRDTCVGFREACVGAFDVELGALEIDVGAFDGATLRLSVWFGVAVDAFETIVGALDDMVDFGFTDDTLEILLGRLPYPSSTRFGRKTASMLLPSKSMTAAL